MVLFFFKNEYLQIMFNFNDSNYESRILLFLGLLSCIGLQMFAQVSVSGKVVDAGGIEMPGVNIAIKGTMVVR